MTLEIYEGHRQTRRNNVSNKVRITLVCNGKDTTTSRLGINGLRSVITGTGLDNVGTTPAALTAALVCTHLNPDIVLNVGTGGGWKKQGAEIGKIYIPDKIQNHDRRLPVFMEGYPEYGVGTLKVPNASALLVQPFAIE